MKAGGQGLGKVARRARAREGERWGLRGRGEGGWRKRGGVRAFCCKGREQEVSTLSVIETNYNLQQ